MSYLKYACTFMSISLFLPFSNDSCTYEFFWHTPYACRVDDRLVLYLTRLYYWFDQPTCILLLTRFDCVCTCTICAD